MHRFVSFNQQIFPAHEVKINLISSAGLYGKGVFTTIAIYKAKPFLWNKHWRRLNENARKLGIDLSDLTEREVFQSLEQLIQQNNIQNARCRLTFFDESSSKIWQVPDKKKTSLLIQTADPGKSKQHLVVKLSPFTVNSKSPLAGVKSCNYLENIIALEEAKAKGFDEAVRINERGVITSACMANIFWFRDEELYTPSLRTGCLPGTTRDFIIKKWEAFEVEEDLEALKYADAVFLTSSGLGVAQVRRFRRKRFASKLHELTQIIETAVRESEKE
jgi:branched-subunit amino acid aminotransferase/4-amino-4-deoxychorismate lyase